MTKDCICTIMKYKVLAGFRRFSQDWNASSIHNKGGKSEDELLQLSLRHDLPHDALRLKENEGNSSGYGVFTHTQLLKGTRFGPFLAVLSSPDQQDDTHTVELADGLQKQLISLQLPVGSWIKFISTPASTDTINCIISVQDSDTVWCEITEDLAEETELMASVSINETSVKVKKETVSPIESPVRSPVRSPDSSQPVLLDAEPAADSATPIPLEEVTPEVKKEVSEVTTIKDAEPVRSADASTKAIKDISGTRPASSSPKAPMFPLIYQCIHCGVKFSNPSTLDAHTTFYCSKRMPQQHFTLHSPIPRDMPTFGKFSNVISVQETKPKSPIVSSIQSPDMKRKSPPSKREYAEAEERANVEESSSSIKAIKPDHVLKCSHCSYTASHPSALSRHLVEHSPSRSKQAASHSPTHTITSRHDKAPHTSPLHPEEMYCDKCKIQFTSMKTYQGHKEFYCEKRHRNCSASTSPIKYDGLRSPASSSTSVSPVGPGISTASRSPAVPVSLVSGPAMSGITGQQHHNVVIAAPILGPHHLSNGLPLSIPTVVMHPIIPEMPQHPSNGLKPCLGFDLQNSQDEKPLDLSLKREVKEVSKDENDIAEASPSSSERLSRSHSSSGRLSAESRVTCTISTPRQQTPKMSPPKKCLECNIEFSTHEVYLIHKEHYCAHRPHVETSRTPSPLTKSSPGAFVQRSGVNGLTPPLPFMPSVLPAVKYICIHCNIPFSNSDTLEAHQQFYCPLKDKKDVSHIVNGLTSPSHIREETTIVKSEKITELFSSPPKGHSCDHCGAILLTAELYENHQKQCRPTFASLPTFACPYCKFISHSDHHLVDHIKCHMTSKYYCCRVCGYRGNTMRGMKMHGKVHAENGERFNFEHDVEEIESDPKQTNKYNGVEDLDMELFLSYQHFTEKYKSLMASAVPLRRQAPHTCVLCNESFPDTSKLRDHMRSHTTEARSYTCKYCEFECESKNDLVRHVKVVHEIQSQKNAQDTNGETQGYSSEKDMNTQTIFITPESEKNDIESDKKHITVDDVYVEVAVKTESKENNMALESKDENNLVSPPTETDPTNTTKPSHVNIVRPLSIRPVAPLSPVSNNLLTEADHNSILPIKSDKSSPRYCKHCDITFMYLATYIAHKKYYCTSSEKNVS